MTLTSMSRADIQARQIRIATAANGWDVTDLHRALEAADHPISYEKVRRAHAGERERELEYDVCKWIAEVTGFLPEFIVGESNELPEWLAKNRLNVLHILGLATHEIYGVAAQCRHPVDSTLFEEWLLGEGLGDSTVLNYRGKVERAHALCVEQGWELEALTASQIRWLAEQWPQTRSTLGQLKGALKHYWTMTDSPAPVKAIRLPSRGGVEEYKGLEDDEAARLEALAYGRTPDGLAVLMGLYLALRRAEMVGLRWEHFDTDLEWVDVLGKGNKRRWLPVHPNLREVLEPGEGWVFPGRFTGHAHTGSVYLWVGRVGEDAEVREDRRHPHALRHTCLTRMYEETGDIRLVQQFAGHADPAQTAKYTRVPRRLLVDAVGRVNYQQAA